METIDKEDIKNWFMQLQESICKALEAADGKSSFATDRWEREGGGGGISRVLTEGNVIERGGVNFSAVEGMLSAKAFQEIMEKPSGDQGEHHFLATGVSLVIHPISPMVPIVHMNVRYFEVSSSNGTKDQWFGGGIDLTPHYVVDEEASFFHSSLKKICDQFQKSYYTEFKKWADDYFYLKHRNETRGVGGIFFDRLRATPEISLNDRFEFVKAVGSLFAPVYTEIISRNKNKPWGEREKKWQLLRRGRYAEFNLLYDRGTKFGLETGGRTESILMSLPPRAEWKYNFIPEKASAEERTMGKLKKGIEWAEKEKQ